MGRQEREMQSEAESGVGQIRNAMKAFAWEQSGVTAIEYALLGALIAMVVLVGITAVGNNVLGIWTYISATVAAAT